METQLVISGTLLLVAIFISILNKQSTSQVIFHKLKFIIYLVGIAVLVIGFYTLGTNQQVGWISIIVSASFLLGTYYFLNIPYTSQGVEVVDDKQENDEPVIPEQEDDEPMHYTKLDPKVVDFIKKGEKEIRLWGGDFSFFEHKGRIDDHPQYQVLKKKKFKKILILGKRPDDKAKEARFGKILHDFRDEVEVKFYNDKKFPDLEIRGLIRREYGDSESYMTLIYKQVEEGYYSVIKSDTTRKGSFIYLKLWRFAWDRADSIKPKEKDIYLKSYQEARHYI